MMKPMPVERSDSAAKIAIETRLINQRDEDRRRVAEAELQHVAGGIGGHAEQAGMAKRNQPGVADEHVQPERKDRVEENLAGDVDVVDAGHPVAAG